MHAKLGVGAEMMCVRVGCQRWGSSRRQAAVPAGGVGACPDNEPTRQATRQHTRSHRCEGRRRAVRGLAAVPVGGGGAWPGFEATRRAKLAARTARGRAAAHGHTKQPGPTAGPSGARNTSGATNKVLRAGRRPRAHKAGVIGHFVLLGLVPGVVVGGGVVEFVPANCVAPAGDNGVGLVVLRGLLPGVFEGCVGGHGGQDCRCWLGVCRVVAPGPGA